MFLLPFIAMLAAASSSEVADLKLQLQNQRKLKLVKRVPFFPFQFSNQFIHLFNKVAVLK